MKKLLILSFAFAMIFVFCISSPEENTTTNSDTISDTNSDDNSDATSGTRTGAICNDGTSSTATGSGACSHHGGVNHWTYN